MEEGRGEELGEESDVPVKELHDMFIEEPNSDSGDDHSMEELEQLVKTTSNPPRRLHDASSPRHKCTLVDPNTGEPCNADFSRAGHLRRHRETFHHLSSSTFPCVVCKKERAFNRLDTLQRHYRQCHPGIEPPSGRTGV